MKNECSKVATDLRLKVALHWQKDWGRIPKISVKKALLPDGRIDCRIFVSPDDADTKVRVQSIMQK